MRQRSSRGTGERGAALLMVLLMLTLVGTVVADFQFNSQVDFQLALNARDELQAEYNALSALRARAILLRNARFLSNSLRQLGGAIGLGADAIPSINQLLSMIPVECGILSAITRVNDPFADSDEQQGGEDGDDPGTDDFFPGECLATSTSEGQKVSLHALRSLRGQDRDRIFGMLVNLLSSPEFERHFEEDDRNGMHAESPDELVGAIADWLDDDNDQRVNTSADEGRHYAFLKESYRPKNAPMDSLAELQLVHGVDDELFGILSDQLTIYSNNTQFALDTADAGTIGLGILSAGATVPEAMCFMAQAQVFQEFSQGFGTMNLQLLRGFGNNCPQGQLDMGALNQVFSARNTDNTWFTIEAEGRVGNVSRKIRAVYQAQEGRFVYARIE